MRNSFSAFLLACLLPLSSGAEEPVMISQAWARATAPGQEVGAAYMVLQSTTDATLIAVTSPSAGSIEIHKMSMNKGVMEMRMLERLPLPAGQAVKLEPGGLHLMLFDLKKPLKTGEQLTLTLKIKSKGGATGTQVVRLPVKSAKD